MLSTGSATYRAEMTLNGASYSTEEFEIKTVPGVVYVSNSGDDSNDGKTPETAKRSLDVLLREFPYGKPYVINAISNVSDSGEKIRYLPLTACTIYPTELLKYRRQLCRKIL